MATAIYDKVAYVVWRMHMENGLWNEKPLIASEISKIYELEKEVRKASGRKELCCPDPDCQHPILRYCHGEKKDAYFAHINNEHCDYADFDRSNSQIIRTIRKILYEHFKACGYQVRPEVKVIDHHYTHLLFDMADNTIVAVEIGTQQLSANQIAYLTKKYAEMNISVKWIVIGDTDTMVRESQTFFIKRYLLNDSVNKDLLVIGWNGVDMAQYKSDPNRYKYNGQIIKSDNYPDTYVDRAPLSSLRFEGNELSLNDFARRYEKWLDKKRVAFNKKLAELEDKSRIEREEQELLRETQKSMPVATSSTLAAVKQESQSPPTKPKLDISYEQRKQEILPLMEQQQTQVRDSLGVRWVKCEKCGIIDTDSKFNFLGGENHINLGVCNNCDGTKRPPRRFGITGGA